MLGGYGWAHLPALFAPESNPQPVDFVDSHNCLETARMETRCVFTGDEKPVRTIMTLHFQPPATDAYDAAVEDAIATCNGDLRGALKALIIANEFLERDLARALASSAARSSAHDWNLGFLQVEWVEAE
jgi:hypothetical protein